MLTEFLCGIKLASVCS